MRRWFSLSLRFTSFLPRLSLIFIFFIFIKVILHAIHVMLDILVLEKDRLLSFLCYSHSTSISFCLLTFAVFHSLLMSLRDFFYHPILSLLINIIKCQNTINSPLIIRRRGSKSMRHIHNLCVWERLFFITTSNIICYRLTLVIFIGSKTIFFGRLRLIINWVLPNFAFHCLLLVTWT